MVSGFTRGDFEEGNKWARARLMKTADPNPMAKVKATVRENDVMRVRLVGLAFDTDGLADTSLAPRLAERVHCPFLAR